MLEKLIWISAFMLVGARHPGATVGMVEKEYRDEASCILVNTCFSYSLDMSELDGLKKKKNTYESN